MVRSVGAFPIPAMLERARRPFIVFLFLAAGSSSLWGCHADSSEQTAIPELDPISEELVAQANAALESDNYAAALALADSAARLAGDHPRVHFLRGSALLDMGRYEDAEEALRSAIEIQEDYPGAWYKLGNAAFRQGQYREAAAAYEKELEKYPAPQPWHNLGAAYESLGALDSALFAFDRAIEADSVYAAAYASKAELLERRGRFDEALPFAQRAVELSSEEARNALVLASLLLKTGQPEEAVPVLTPVAKAEPWNYGVLYNLGVVVADPTKLARSSTARRRSGTASTASDAWKMRRGSGRTVCSS